MPSYQLDVLIPAYNAERFLPTCLASVRKAHRDGYRFLFIDDHSTDATPEILEAAAAESPFIDFVRNDRNLGVAASRNVLHGLVDARYLTYLDVDDWYGENHLESMVRAIDDLEVDFLRTDHVIVDGLKRTVARTPETQRGIRLDPANAFGVPGPRSPLNYLYIWAGIYDLERLNLTDYAFHEHLRTASDRPWIWKLYLDQRSTAAIDLDTYFYRKSTNATALTQRGDAATLDFLVASEIILGMATASGNARAVDKAAHSLLFLVDYHLERAGRLTAALTAELTSRSAALLATCPTDSIEAALPAFSAQSLARLRPVLAGLEVTA
ncbi:glycosyltransferase family 2 protein [Demequina salsinemoris]|uniref:glycosyltransferase family 2 protein n=1 Tax=Demequina salsinemoris TaxID=577470 RepID=UPI000782F96B|nr:glycosyltransferase family 2 protein [Demequina salsinemoris]